MKEGMTKIIKIKKLDLKSRRRKGKENYNSIYIVSRKIRVKSKHQPKEQIK